MNQNENETPKPQQDGEPGRRIFLTSLMAGSIALPAAVIAADRKGKGGGKAGGKGGKGAKGGQAGGKGKAGGRSRGGQQVDGLKIASALLDQFDKDNDNALNLDELQAAITALYGGRISAGGQARGSRGGGKGGKAGKAGGMGQGESQSSGGVTPKRPGEE